MRKAMGFQVVSTSYFETKPTLRFAVGVASVLLAIQFLAIVPVCAQLTPSGPIPIINIGETKDIINTSFSNLSQTAITNNGTATVSGCLFSGNTTIESAILNSSGGRLTVIDSIFLNNHQSNPSHNVGGAISNSAGGNSNVNLTVTTDQTSVFLGNTGNPAPVNGGQWNQILPTTAESSDQLPSRRSCTG